MVRIMLVWCTYLKNVAVVENGCCMFSKTCDFSGKSCYVIVINEKNDVSKQINEIKKILFKKL